MDEKRVKVTDTDIDRKTRGQPGQVFCGGWDHVRVGFHCSQPLLWRWQRMIMMLNKVNGSKSWVQNVSASPAENGHGSCYKEQGSDTERGYFISRHLASWSQGCNTLLKYCRSHQTNVYLKMDIFKKYILLFYKILIDNVYGVLH